MLIIIIIMTNAVGQQAMESSTTEAVVKDCVNMIAEMGLQRAFATCKEYLIEAKQYCQSAGSESCNKMLVNIGIARVECELESEVGVELSELCMSVISKKQSRADCKADQLFGQIPGSSDIPVCVDAPLDKQSNTQRMPLRMFQPKQHQIHSSSSAKAMQHVIIIPDDLVQVYTIPIGQGDCNYHSM